MVVSTKLSYNIIKKKHSFEDHKVNDAYREK